MTGVYKCHDIFNSMLYPWVLSENSKGLGLYFTKKGINIQAWKIQPPKDVLSQSSLVSSFRSAPKQTSPSQSMCRLNGCLFRRSSCWTSCISTQGAVQSYLPLHVTAIVLPTWVAIRIPTSVYIILYNHVSIIHFVDKANRVFLW